MRTKVILAVLTGMLAGALLSGSSPAASPAAKAAADPQAYDIRFGTAAVGTGSYSFALAERQVLKKYAPEINLKLLPTTGGAQNVQMLKAKEVEIGACFSYLDGKKADWWNNVALLFPHLPIYSLAIVQQDSPVKTWEDIKGKRICPGPKGATSTIYWEKLLLSLGWQPDKDFSLRYAAYGDTPAMIRDGTVDVLLLGGGLDTPYAQELFTTMKSRFIDLPRDRMNAFHAKDYPPDSYPEVTIPAGLLKGITKDYHTWVSPYCHVAQKTVPDGVVSRWLQALWDHQSEAAAVYAPIGLITKEIFDVKFPIPYHPAALKYFQDKGWVKK